MSPKPQYLLQYLANTYKDINTINYKTELNKRLHKERLFEKGELIQVNYFDYKLEPEEVDGETTYNLVKTDLVVKVDISYKRDANGNALSRTTVRTYTQLLDPTSFGSNFKETTKLYDVNQSYIESKRRRTNVIDGILSKLNSYVSLDVGFGDLMVSCNASITPYILYGSNELYLEISTYVLPALDELVGGSELTVRETLLEELTF